MKRYEAAQRAQAKADQDKKPYYIFSYDGFSFEIATSTPHALGSRTFVSLCFQPRPSIGALNNKQDNKSLAYRMFK